MLHNAAVITLISFAALITAYFTYGRFIARRLCRLDPNRVTPSHSLRDGIDYVPTRTPILFGHHFASIAGLGPILGPSIAVLWGWLPAVLWVVFGCIFIGAVHDLTALTLSLRHQGRSVGDICRNVIGPRARLLALLIIFFMMSLAMGAFCNAISDLFVNFNPDAIIPSFGLMVVAVVFGIAIYRFRIPLAVGTVIALAVFGGLILWGVERPVCTYEWFAAPETRAALEAARSTEPAEGRPEFHLPYGADAATKYLKAVGDEEAVADLGNKDTEGTAVYAATKSWIGVLLLYGFLASVLPVWLLLQPRDYINSFQLYFTLGAMLLGLVLAALAGSVENRIESPMIRTDVAGAPMGMFPLLFVTIACGAVSGFHSLVSSGTTVKQLNRETDALPIGYGAMLVEGALAILVIMACVAGLETSAWQKGGAYADWAGIGGSSLAVQLNAMFRGGANFLTHVGIPAAIGRTILAVTVVAFALTTLDSATRLLRFNVEEICRSINLKFLANRYAASAIAVTGIAFFALVPAGKTLWTLFGTVNQLLAGLTLLTISVFLYKLRRPVLYTLVPMIVMLVMSIWAMSLSMIGFWEDKKWSLLGVSVAVLAMSLWLIVEGLLAFGQGRADLDAAGEEPQAEAAR